jgi:3-oxoacyl-[acyl-carrier protein] reductase
MTGLSKKRIFITGAARGIGLATAQKFFDLGSELILIDRPTLKESELDLVFQERMTYISGDVTQLETLQKIEAEMAKGIYALINNAGITKDAQLHKMTDDDWNQVIDVNLTSVFKLSRMAAVKMKENGAGVILNASSVVAHYGNFGQANYVASKAGLIGMTKTLAKELGKYSVRVNAVAPGFILTPMVKEMPQKVIDMMTEKTPLKRMGTPEDIAAAYAFLASNEASFITGTCLNVDGGIILG